MGFLSTQNARKSAKQVEFSCSGISVAHLTALERSVFGRGKGVLRQFWPRENLCPHAASLWVCGSHSPGFPGQASPQACPEPLPPQDDLLSLKVVSVLHHLSIKRAIQVLRINGFEPNCLRRRPSDEVTHVGRDVAGQGGRLLLHAGPPLLPEPTGHAGPLLYTDTPAGSLHPQSSITPLEVQQWTNHRVMEWLRSVDLAEYAPNLRGSGVHGGLMVKLLHFLSDLLPVSGALGWGV